ncbi:ATP-binding cassette domain-containing protein [Mycoplasma sp. P36-A1]|uniref:ATP-binding cassette domain-containing protein n=1 Tax=Mycoplasma sp. P36-A1 TaxID=3252900 RepID=UPI003C2CD99E
MLEIKNYNFVYDEKTIYKNANLVLKNKHIYGLIGPNGSGKTTLLQSLVAANFPNSGEIIYDNISIYENLYYQRHSSYLSDEFVITNKSARKLVNYYSKVLSKSINWNIFDSLMEKLQIDPDDLIANQSKGKRKSAMLIVSLALEPRFIYLDEYLDGLDVVRRSKIKEFLINYVFEYEAIIIISSHTLDDIKDICDNLIFINDNIINAPEDIDTVRNKYATYQIVSDQPLDRDFFIKKGIFVKQFKKLDNIVWIAVKNDDNVLEKLQDITFKDIRRINSTFEEVVYYELIS